MGISINDGESSDFNKSPTAIMDNAVILLAENRT